MIGSKPLTDAEADAIIRELPSTRAKCLFILGLSTGFRISELLSIRKQDVVQYGQVRESLIVQRREMKGRQCSRSVPLQTRARVAIACMLKEYTEIKYADDKLFSFGRKHADRLIKEACARAGVMGRVSTHSMRKTFAKRVYEALGKDLINTQRALGHKSVQSTVSYLSFDEEAVTKAILGE